MAKSLTQILEARGMERRMNYALDRFTAALTEVGNPEKDVYSLVIAGTNGKGSTTLYLSSALRRAGYKVMTYLSPHLQSPTERLCENLVPIEEEALLQLAQEFEKTAEKFSLSYFEFLTLLFFVWAKREAADFSVIEVGLGGRLDATNVTDPIGSLITNIAFDHQEYLGNTLSEILSEKLGILRKESLLFTGIRDPKLLEQLEKRCLELDAVYYLSKELKREPREASWQGQSFSVNGYPLFLNNPSVGSQENGALAFLAMRILFPRLPLSLSQAAFSEVVQPGRMEIVQESPRVVLSGDHNPAGIDCLTQTLTRLKAKELKIVCGFSPDKPHAEMIEKLKPFSKDISLTQVSRFQGQMPQGYDRLLPFEPDACRAVENAMKSLGPNETLLVTGSLYLVGEVRRLWHSKVEYLKTPPSVPPPTFEPRDGSNRAKPHAAEEEQNLSR